MGTCDGLCVASLGSAPNSAACTAQPHDKELEPTAERPPYPPGLGTPPIRPIRETHAPKAVLHQKRTARHVYDKTALAFPNLHMQQINQNTTITTPYFVKRAMSAPIESPPPKTINKTTKIDVGQTCPIGRNLIVKSKGFCFVEGCDYHPPLGAFGPLFLLNNQCYVVCCQRMSALSNHVCVVERFLFCRRM